MVRLIFLASALFATSTAAIACQCRDPATMTDADRQQQARSIARMRPSIAVVRLVRSGDGERYRTVKHLMGPPQRSYPAENAPGPATSCDYRIVAGEQAIMVFVPQEPARLSVAAMRPAPAVERTYAPAGTCIQLFIQAPGGIDQVRAAAVQLKTMH